jgi:hypothetical protein
MNHPLYAHPGNNFGDQLMQDQIEGLGGNFNLDDLNSGDKDKERK